MAAAPRLPIPEDQNQSLATPRCSCPTCDSLLCFIKQQNSEVCYCQQCENSKTCLYYPEKTGTDKQLVKTVKIQMEGEDTMAKESVKREITYENDEVVQNLDVSKADEAVIPGDKESGAVKIDNNEHSSTHGQDVADNITPKDQPTSAAMLSAQVMNIPYENTHDNDVNKTAETASYKMSAYEVIKKIRDAYKACSCKVCECLVGKSLVPKNNLCKCEPCDCEDCMKFLSKFQYLDLEREELDPPIGCPCIRCTRSQCKAITNRYDEPQICDCPPRDDLKRVENYSKPCNCEPCQCMECKTMSLHGPRTFIVAPVGEQHQRRYCDCSPCECVECGGHGTPTNLMREAATGVNRHPRCHCEACVNEACVADGSQTCKCERHSRIITKPVEKDVRDYDIRAIVTNEKIIRNTNSRPLRNNTIAMFAKVPYLYNNTSSQKECSCDVCECDMSHCKESVVDSIKSSRLFKDSIPCQYVLKSPIEGCQCFPCECQICSKKVESKRKPHTAPKTCKSDVSDCLNCEGKLKEVNNKFRSYVNGIKEECTSQSCKCNPCECVKCTNSIVCGGDVCSCAQCCCEHCFEESKESIYPVKKAELLTPYSFVKEIQNNCYNYKYDNFSVKDNCKKSSNVKLYDSQGKITIQKDSIPYLEYTYPQHYRLVNNMEYTHHPVKEIKTVPKVGNIQYKNINDIYKYDNQNISKYIYMQGLMKDHTQSKRNESDNSLFSNVKDYNIHRRVPVLTEPELCANSCDSGCSSFDYYTVLPASSKLLHQNNQESVKARSSFEINSYTDKDIKNTIHRQFKTGYTKDFNESLGRHHHSFESDNRYSSPKEDIDKDHSKNGTVDSNRVYGHQYWIKNVDVSMKVRDPTTQDSKQKNDLDNGSDENLSYTENIADRSMSSCGKQGEDWFSSEAYYEGVQKTLYRARAFSSQLMKILEKYERANSEFQSITQRLKVSHASLLGGYNIEEANNEKDKNCLSAQSMDMKTENTNISLKDNPMRSETSPWSSVSNDLRKINIKEPCQQLNNSSVFTFSNDSELGGEKLEYFGDVHSINRGKTKRYQNDIPMICDRKKRGIKKLNKSGTRMFKQLVIIPKGAQSTSATNRAGKSVISTQTVPQVQLYGEVDTNANSLSNLYVSTKDEKAVLPISKKNFYLTSNPVTMNKGISFYPTLQGEAIQAVRSMSMQTKPSNIVDPPPRNVALQNLQVEVQKLLEMPLLQQLQNKTYTYSEPQTMWPTQAIINDLPNVKNTTSCQTVIDHIKNNDFDYSKGVFNQKVECKNSKSCCDALKVNFLGVRRVSDHTVLVKWTAPRVTSDVTGYEVRIELLVDGRAVQKVLSPSRCVAVVTCLPHCDTLLLTIRTITSRTPSGHFPSSTIVYRPRAK